MSSNLKSEKSGNIRNDSGNGQALMNSAYQNTTVKSKVDFIYGAVPSRSKNDILLVLQSCDYNVDAAISIFSQDRADDILNEWRHTPKKSKDGNKRKRNKKKPASANTQDVEPKKEKEKNPGQELPADKTQTCVEQSLCSSEPVKPQVPTDLNLNTNGAESSQEPNVNGVSTLSSNSSTSFDPVTPSDENAALHNKQKEHPNHSSSHHHHHKNNKHHHQPKTEKLSPATGIDALKKTTKDLSRSSFSLGRYQLVLEEECEESLKRMTKTFENIRNCIDERQATLSKALAEFKEEAVKLLQQRAEDAAALKLKTDRVQSMSEEQIALLRADIKNFVAERKIDEELAQTKRFICDEENFLQGIKTFGEVVPIKSTYTPVILNHPTPSVKTQAPLVNHPSSTLNRTTPSTAQKLSSAETQAPLVSHPSATINHPTPSTAQKPPSAETRMPLENHPPEIKVPNTTSPNVSESSAPPKKPEPTPVRRHPIAATSGRPPKIESLISSAMAKTSIAVGNLHNAAEIHSNLNEDVKKQGDVSKHEAKTEHSNQEHKQPHKRPTTAPHQPGRQQYKRTQEPRPRRPQSSRQGNRSNQRHNKDEKTSDKLNETSQTDEARAKTNQRGSTSQDEKRKEGKDGRQKSTEGRQSNPSQEGGYRRSSRRRKRRGSRDEKAKLNGEEPAKEAPESSTEKESVTDLKDGQSANEDHRVEQTSDKTKEKNVESKKEATLESKSTDGALPQRSTRTQNRRRRGKDHKEEAASQQVNGASNGEVNNHATREEEKAELAGKEEKIPKLPPVVDPPLINGHGGTHEEKTAKQENHEKLSEKENIEINGFATTNGNGEECMVGR